MEQIVNTLIWAAMFQGLLLGLIYLFSKKYRSHANRILGFFLLAFVFEALTNSPISHIGDYATNGYFTLPEVKLLFPILILHYVLEKLGRSKAYLRFLKIHYVLAFLAISITLVNVMMFAFKGTTIDQVFDFHTIETAFMAMQYYAFFLTLAVIALSIRETRTYTQLIKSTYSDLDLMQIRWLLQFIYSIIPIALVWGLELVRIAKGGTGPSAFASLTWILLILFVYFLSYRAYQQKNLLENIPPTPEPEPYRNTNPSSGQPPEQDYADMSLRLKTYVEAKKPYLRHDLTLYDLAKEMGESPRLISGCINRNFSQNFAEWINRFRVQLALERLKDPAYGHLSVEGIGSESGFKSRSAMYAAFKRETGHSPGHFRED